MRHQRARRLTSGAHEGNERRHIVGATHGDDRKSRIEPGLGVFHTKMFSHPLEVNKIATSLHSQMLPRAEKQMLGYRIASADSTGRMLSRSADKLTGVTTTARSGFSLVARSCTARSFSYLVGSTIAESALCKSSALNRQALRL